MKEKQFTMEEVEALVKNAYEVGFCDGIDGDGDSTPNADVFWEDNIDQWLSGIIPYLEIVRSALQ